MDSKKQDMVVEIAYMYFVKKATGEIEANARKEMDATIELIANA